MTIFNETTITLFFFYLIIDLIVKSGYQFNSTNFTLKYILGINCYACFSLRVGIVVQLFNLLFFNNFNLIPILAVNVLINITSRI